MWMPLSPDNGEWFALLMLEDEQTQAEDGSRANSPHQVLIRIEEEIAKI